jgi:2-polyprenyl-3-methyl-5-hydroxy-6-metoxy-1,4-benzoquinol methylase
VHFPSRGKVGDGNNQWPTGYQGSSRITTGESTSAHVVDERLTLVNDAIPDIFSDVDVLDIGCNDGRITVGVGAFGPLAIAKLQS